MCVHKFMRVYASAMHSVDDWLSKWVYAEKYGAAVAPTAGSLLWGQLCPNWPFTRGVFLALLLSCCLLQSIHARNAPLLLLLLYFVFPWFKMFSIPDITIPPRSVQFLSSTTVWCSSSSHHYYDCTRVSLPFYLLFLYKFLSSHRNGRGGTIAMRWLQTWDTCVCRLVHTFVQQLTFFQIHPSPTILAAH